MRRADAGLEVAAAGDSGMVGEQLSLVTAETINELQEQLDVAMRENEVLAEQVSLYESDIESTRDALAERDTQLAAANGNFDTAAKALKQMKATVDGIKAERDALKEEIDVATKREADASVSMDRVTAELSDARASKHQIEEQLRDHKRALTEVAEKANRENEVLEKQAIALAKRAREVKALLVAKETEFEAIKADYAALKMEHEATRKDCEGMLKVMEGMERQIAEYATREEETVMLAKEAHDKVEKALIERDQALAREVQSRREVARSIERRKEYLKDCNQREAAAADHARAEMQLAANDLEKRIKELETKLAAVEHQKERAKQDCADARESARDTKASMMAEISDLKIKSKSLQEVANQAEKELYKVRIDCKGTTESAEQKALAAERERDSLDEKLRALEKRHSETKHAADSGQIIVRQLQTENQRLEQETAQLKKDLSDALLNSQNEASAEVKRFADENNPPLRSSESTGVE